MTDARPLRTRVTIWLGTAAVTLGLVAFAQALGLVNFDAPDDPQAQQLDCSADQMSADGRCL